MPLGFENRWWRFTANQGTGFTDEMRMHIAWDISPSPILYIIVAPLCLAFLKRVHFYKAHHSEKRGMLWLASYPVRCDWPEYLKRETEMLRPLPYCDAVSRRGDTQTIKPIINEAFVASSGDIITDYNNLYCLFTLKTVNITMSAFVIGETVTSTTLHSSKLVFESSVAHSLNKKTYLQAVSQKCQTVHFIETAFVQASIVGYSSRFRK